MGRTDLPSTGLVTTPVLDFVVWSTNISSFNKHSLITVYESALDITLNKTDAVSFVCSVLSGLAMKVDPTVIC